MTGRFDGVVVRVGVGDAVGDDPRAQVLRRLREALLDPGELNYLSEFLRSEGAG